MAEKFIGEDGLTYYKILNWHKFQVLKNKPRISRKFRMKEGRKEGIKGGGTPRSAPDGAVVPPLEWNGQRHINNFKDLCKEP